jgi:hypothetical protein
MQARRLGIPQGRHHQLLYRFVDVAFAKSSTENPLTRRSLIVDRDYYIWDLSDGVDRWLPQFTETTTTEAVVATVVTAPSTGAVRLDAAVASSSSSSSSSSALSVIVVEQPPTARKNKRPLSQPQPSVAAASPRKNRAKTEQLSVQMIY